MAELVYTAITSLDGYVADADGRFDWAAPDEEVHAFVNDLERAAGTYLYGRRKYETMRFWEDFPEIDASPVSRGLRRIWRAADKVVFSRTLDGVTSARTRLVRGSSPTRCAAGSSPHPRRSASADRARGARPARRRARRRAAAAGRHARGRRRRHPVAARRDPAPAGARGRPPVRLGCGLPPLPHPRLTLLLTADDEAGVHGALTSDVVGVADAGRRRRRPAPRRSPCHSPRSRPSRRRGPPATPFVWSNGSATAPSSAAAFRRSPSCCSLMGGTLRRTPGNRLTAMGSAIASEHGATSRRDHPTDRRGGARELAEGLAGDLEAGANLDGLRFTGVALDGLGLERLVLDGCAPRRLHAADAHLDRARLLDCVISRLDRPGAAAAGAVLP